MAERKGSVARTVVVAGLVLQFVLTVLQILQSYAWEVWVRRALAGEGEPVLGTVVLLLLLALVVPAARGWRWALALATVLQLLLTIEMVPWLVRKFAQPEVYVQWILNLAYCVVGALATAYGVVALREAQPADWSLRRGSARQTVPLLAVLSAFVGMAIAGAGIAQRPAATAVLSGVPDTVVTLSMDRLAFSPARLELPAGRRVALVLVNHYTDEHSFDVDAQDVHVQVPAGSSALALVRVPASGELPFYCGVPGHTQAGMTGVIVPR